MTQNTAVGVEASLPESSSGGGGGEWGTQAGWVPHARDSGEANGLEPGALLLKPVEVARLLGLSRSKVFELLAAGELPVIRIGRATRVPMVELQRWIQDQVRRHPRTERLPLAELELGRPFAHLDG